MINTKTINTRCAVVNLKIGRNLFLFRFRLDFGLDTIYLLDLSLGSGQAEEKPAVWQSSSSFYYALNYLANASNAAKFGFMKARSFGHLP